MKISYKWLKEYIDIDISIEELAQKITDSGIEVEEIIPLIPEVEKIVLGKVESVIKHPAADKLSICKVSDGTETLQVICGAPNVAEGQLIPFAQVGAVLPNGMKIKKAKIRGEASYGMICSKEELGLEENSDGIWPLKTDQKLGTDINIVLANHKDYIFDLFITSNRPDCLSHIGIAREIAAFTGKSVKWPEISINESSQKTEDHVSVTIEYQSGCPRYAARVIKNVKIGPSPEWLVTKLETIGLRSINNVVDITNFVLNELGQPLHAFDYDLIEGQSIIVKKSKNGDIFYTLDDKKRNLPENTVMICDAKRSVAIGGIMGGQNSEVSNNTANILLESAYFNPQNIIQSARNLGMMTDASQRFEKGTDYKNVIYALDRATMLIQELAGGEVLSGAIDAFPTAIDEKVISFDPSRVNRILGSDLSDQSIMKTLEKLDFNSVNDRISVPSYRVDINEDIDLIEEVARLTNLDNLPTSKVEPVYLDQQIAEKDVFISLIRSTLVELGLQEIFTNSMISNKAADIIDSESCVKILNPISDDLSTMRPSLLPGILNSIEYNQNRNATNLRIFEIGRIFKKNNKNELPVQPVHLSIALTGKRNRDFWGSNSSSIDFYDIKGLVESFFEKTHLDNYDFIIDSENSHYEHNNSVKININGKYVGNLGKINDTFSDIFDIENDVYLVDFCLDDLIKYIDRDKKYKSIGKYPYIEKDLALILENKISSSEVINFIENQGGNLLKKVDVFDVYSGKNIGDGLKSLAFRLTFQSDERTLNDSEIDQIFRKIIRKSEIEFNASLRDK